MKRLFSVVVLAALLVVVPTASADVAPIKLELPRSVEDVAVDGSDVYTLTARHGRDRNGETSTYVITRRSLIDSSRQQILTLPLDAEVDSLLAGGGWAYFQSYEYDDSGEPRAKVERVSRDGSVRQVVAEGTEIGYTESWSEGWPKEVVLKCGTAVSLETVSATGTAVIGVVTMDRSTKSCGNKPNRDVWRYTAVQADGTRKPIIDLNGKVSVKHMKDRWRLVQRAPAGGFSTAGDQVLFGTRSNKRLHLFNLQTAGLFGPFAPRSGATTSFSSVNAAGQIAVSSYWRISKRKTGTSRGVFRDPLNPTSYSEFPGGRALTFCGNHLLGINGKDVQEYDPMTFAPLRRIFSMKGITTFPDCEGGVLLSGRSSGGKAVLNAYPIDPLTS